MPKKQTVEKIVRVVPLNDAQRDYISILNGPASVILCCGPAGSGKSLLACDVALRSIFNGRFEKVVVTRPVVESGEKLGFLPGELDEKFAPYIAPIIDACNFCGHDWNKIRHSVSPEPLAFMRGKTFRRSFIIADEMQNATHEQMIMLLTRIGEGSKLVINGDLDQSDIPSHRQGALWKAITVLTDIDGVETFEFPENSSVRNPLINSILKHWNS